MMSNYEEFGVGGVGNWTDAGAVARGRLEDMLDVSCINSHTALPGWHYPTPRRHALLALSDELEASLPLLPACSALMH
jgi:hypothetical protein